MAQHLNRLEMQMLPAFPWAAAHVVPWDYAGGKDVEMQPVYFEWVTYPLYAVEQENDIVVTLHTGTLWRVVRALPVLLDCARMLCVRLGTETQMKVFQPQFLPAYNQGLRTRLREQNGMTAEEWENFVLQSHNDDMVAAIRADLEMRKVRRR